MLQILAMRACPAPGSKSAAGEGTVIGDQRQPLKLHINRCIFRHAEMLIPKQPPTQTVGVSSNLSTALAD